MKILDGTDIGLSYGLTVIRARDAGNKLVATLANVFKKEWEIRSGKITDTPIEVQIDFERVRAG